VDSLRCVKQGLHFTWDPAGNPITVPVSALQWGAEDKVIISGGLDGKVHVWTSDMGYEHQRCVLQRFFDDVVTPP